MPRHSHGPGKTREEMVQEARAAYKRRDEELAQQRLGQEVVNTSNPAEEAVPKKQRTWWDLAAYDGLLGMMSPVAEEGANPLDSIVTADHKSPTGPSSGSNSEQAGQQQQLDKSSPNDDSNRHEADEKDEAASPGEH